MEVAGYSWQLRDLRRAYWTAEREFQNKKKIKVLPCRGHTFA